MNNFQYHRPQSMEEALGLLADHGDDARIISGGTSLLLFMKQRLVQPGHLISLQDIPGLDDIALTDEGVSIGAMCSHRAVETSPVVRQAVPLLSETYRYVATPRIRNMATVGGGLVHADPNLDPPPSLIVLGAQVVLTSASGERAMPVEEFFLDYYETAIEPGEIVSRVVVPHVPPNSGSSFIKFLPRTADDYATVSAAAYLTLSDDGSSCKDVRIGLGSVGATPIRGRGAEDVLRGRPVTPELIHRTAQAVGDEVEPMDDFRGSANYKRQMAVVFTRRTLERALADIRENP